MAAATNRENTALAWLKRLWPLLLLLAGTAFVFAMGWHRYLSLQELVDRREALRAAISGHTVLAILVFMWARAEQKAIRDYELLIERRDPDRPIELRKFGRKR